MIKSPISKKILRSNMILLFGTFVAILSAITILNLNQSNHFLADMKSQIKSGLLAKGKTLVLNNAQAMSGMVAENSFIAIQNLVSKTVEADSEIVFGTYMSIEDNQAWVYANDSNPSGELTEVFKFTDSISVYISKSIEADHLSRVYSGIQIFEFYAPIHYDDEILGFIRYGISKENLIQTITETQEESANALHTLLLIISYIALACLVIAFFIVKFQAANIARPIKKLVEVSNTIANGNYTTKSDIYSDDEVGELAISFDTMRETILKHTLHLEDLIDEKLKQVRSILNNIDQGLFTVEKDGTINDEYSKSSNSILGFQDISQHSIFEILNFSKEETKIWHDWISIVSTRHKRIRWKKIARLAPVLDREINDENGIKNLEINYQPINDKYGELESIMVLVDDVTESKRLNQLVEIEKSKHKREVHVILSLVNSVPESLDEFFKDTSERFLDIQETFSTQTANTLPEDFILEDEAQQSISINLHTIKGNAATFGFDILSIVSHDLEDIILDLSNSESTDKEQKIKQFLNSLRLFNEETVNILKLSEKLHGKDASSSEIIKEKTDAIISLCSQALSNEQSSREESILKIRDACQKIRYIPLDLWLKRYSNVIEKTSSKLNKRLSVVVEPPGVEINPDLFKDINESILHIIRNALYHGIEEKEQRIDLGKELPGTLLFKLDYSSDFLTLTISDDGKGIDVQNLIVKAQQQNIISKEDAENITDEEALELLFSPNFSTVDHTDTIAGRGIGLNSVRSNLKKLNSKIKISSEPNVGSHFTLTIPLSES